MLADELNIDSNIKDKQEYMTLTSERLLCIDIKES